MEKLEFAMTLGALKELSEKCPDKDIEKINTLFEGRNIVDTMDNMVWFVLVLNKWGTYKASRSFEGALTEDDVYSLEIDEIQGLFDPAMSAFRKDKTPSMEVVSNGKKDIAPKE